MNVTVFPPARSRDSRTNLDDFIAKGRASASFGRVDWDAAVWPNVEMKVKKRITAGKQSESLNFLLHGAERGTTDKSPIPEPMCDFAKALVRIREATKPTAIENHRVVIRAIRLLVKALEGQEPDPCTLLPHHFDEAANIARREQSALTAYATGKALAIVAEALQAYNITRVRIDWSNTVPRPHSQDRVTDEAKQTREDRLPSEAALSALPEMSNMVTEDDDVLRMRTIELFVCGGWRLNELLTVPADCEVEEPQADGTVRYGIRYRAEKGFEHSVKWIPSVLVDMAKRAIADIKRITDPVRSDAKWMLDHPGMVNIPELWQEPDRLWIQKHFASMMGFGVHYPIKTYLGVSSVGTNRYRAGYRASDILAALRAKVPVVEGPLPLESHLFLIRENMLHRQRGVLRGSVRFLTGPMVTTFLSPQEGRSSMFDHFGFTEPDGSPIKVTSHQFRHWLNTLAQEGGLSQELIARWSGRKDMAQNAAYDHVSGRKLAEHVRQLAEAGSLMGPMAKVRDALPPVDRRTFIETAIASAHVTEIGLCVHDWTLAPCPNHGDCSNCGEHVIDKGNEKHVAEAERQLEEIEHMLVLTDPQVQAETYGAARWQEAHRRRRDGLRAALAVHHDETISDGTLVHQSRR